MVKFVVLLYLLHHKIYIYIYIYIYELIEIQHNYQFIIKWMKNAKTNRNFMTKNLQTDQTI